MQCVAIYEQDNVPTLPMAADLAQDFSEMFLMQLGRGEVEILTRSDVHHPRQEPAIVMTEDGRALVLRSEPTPRATVALR